MVATIGNRRRHLGISVGCFRRQCRGDVDVLALLRVAGPQTGTPGNVGSAFSRVIGTFGYLALRQGVERLRTVEWMLK